MNKLILLLAFPLGGCLGLGMQNMTPAQIRATNGMTTCTQVLTMYGRGSTISANTDDIRKGATAKGKTAVKCGDAEMVIENDIGVAQPAPKPAPLAP